MRSALEREAARLLHELAAGRSVGARLRHGRELAEGLEQGARERFEQLRPAGVVCDFRHPDVIRLAPVPMYTSFGDVYRTAEILGGA